MVELAAQSLLQTDFGLDLFVFSSFGRFHFKFVTDDPNWFPLVLWMFLFQFKHYFQLFLKFQFLLLVLVIFIYLLHLKFNPVAKFWKLLLSVFKFLENQLFYHHLDLFTHQHQCLILFAYFDKLFNLVANHTVSVTFRNLFHWSFFY